MVSAREWPEDGGETGALIRAFDWTQTGLGARSTWPQSLRTAVDIVLASPIPMVMLWGSDGIMIYNDAYSGFAAGRHPRLLGSKVLEGWAEVADFNRRVMSVGLAGGTLSFRDQHLVLHRNGVAEDVWMDLDYSPIRDESGRAAGVLAIVVETTKRVQAEAAVREGDDFKRLLLDSTEEGFYSVDREGVTTLCNAAFVRMLGFASAAEAVGRKLHDVTHHTRADGSPYPDDQCPIAIAARTGTPAHVVDELFYRRDGSSFPVEYRVQPILRDGELQGALCIVADISERKKTEAAARDSELRYATLLDVSPQVVWFADADARITYCNSYWYDYTGLTPEATRGDGWASVIHPEHRHRVLAAWKAHVETCTGWEMEIPFRRASDGVFRWHLARGTPMLDSGGVVERWTGVAFDIDDRKRAGERQTALVELSDRLRDMRGRADIAGAAAAILGRTLATARAGYATVDETAEYAEVDGEWTNGAVTSLIGRHRLPSFGNAFTAILQRGDIVAIADVHEDAATRQHAGAFDAIAVRSLLNVPLLEAGRLVAIIYLHDTVPRPWSAEDVALVRDVVERTWAAAERARNEVALRDSVELFRTLAESVPHHVWTARPDGYLNWYNARVYQYAGVAPGELDGEKWGRIVHPDDLPATFAAWEKAISDSGVYQAEFRLRRASDGAYRWFLARAVPVRDPNGAVMRWIGTNTDVHDQKTTAEQLAQLNRDLEKRVAERTADRDRMWRLSQDLMVVTRRDRAVTIIAVNPAWERVLGHREHELIGKSLLALIHPDDYPAAERAAATLIQGGQVRDYRSRVKRRDGEWSWISWVGTTEGDYNVGVGRDVTAEEASAQALREAEDALRQSQKMEAVGQLTGGIAHDFNNLLQGIVGSLDLIQQRIAQGRGNDLDRFISGAMTSANRAAALTHRLLAFSRRQPLDPKPVNVNALVSSMEDLLRRTMGERIEIELVLAGGLWLTLCDQNQLESALLNLAINARDAMPDGGKLTVETGNAHLDATYVATQRDISPGQYVCLSVTDSGTGMTPDIVQRAFDPFFTTKPMGQGTGLGLSMIYGFARQSEGYAKIYSEAGHGTTVKLYLPRYRGARHAEEPAPDEVDIHRSDVGESILVVEDETVVRGLIVEILADLGYRVLEAADGPSALAIVQSSQRIDLLVTDIGLPGLNGRQLADAARSRRAGLKVLFMTGYAENAALSRGFLEPGMEMMTKPFAIERLASRVRAMLVTS